jgi:hypothetical protein
MRTPIRSSRASFFFGSVPSEKEKKGALFSFEENKQTNKQTKQTNKNKTRKKRENKKGENKKARRKKSLKSPKCNRRAQKKRSAGK